MNPATSPQLPILAPSEAIDAPIESSPDVEKLSDSNAGTSMPSGINPQAGWKQGGLYNSTTSEVSENLASKEDDEDDEDDDEDDEEADEDEEDEDSSLSSEDIRVSYR